MCALMSCHVNVITAPGNSLFVVDYAHQKPIGRVPRDYFMPPGIYVKLQQYF